jgi:dTMP kinase
MKNYKLVVIEGVDSSGKQTQSELLMSNIESMGLSVEKIVFPNYDSDTSSLVKMYLGGEFGENANDVNPYMASAFFAVDRVGSMFSVWKQRLENTQIVIADRYVTSNMIHQASKIENPEERDAFLDWVYDFEYEKLSLPKPDLIIFLDMPVKYAMELMKNRPNKINSSDIKDIHESDEAYLNKSYNNAVSVAQKYNWHTVSCVKDGKIRSIEDISEEILNVFKIII